MPVHGTPRPARVATAAFLAALAIAVSAAAAKDPEPIDLPGLLARIGERVEAYYWRAQSIICAETVRMQTLDRTLTPDPFARILVYELRVSRYQGADGEPPPDPTVVRQLKTINGRVPKSNKEDSSCLDLNDVALDPLSFLLPSHQAESRFSYKGQGRVGARPAVMIDYAPVSSAPVQATWTDGCVSIDAPGRTTGRLWIDTMTGDIVRLDEQMRGPVELEIPMPQRRPGGETSMTFERTEVSIRYKAVTFTDPDETVILPASVETLSLAGGGSSYRSVRVTHTYAGYQRFFTGGRIVQE
jgi:hypothetical protein